MEKQMQSSDACSTIDPSQRYQRLANFLLAVILRLEGVKRRQPTPTVVYTTGETQQYNFPEQQEPSSLDASPATSRSPGSPRYQTPWTSKKASPSTSLRSRSSSESNKSQKLKSVTAQTSPMLTKKSTVTPAETQTTTTLATDVGNTTDVQNKRRFCPCPCQIFYTPDANLNPRMLLNTGGGKFGSIRGGASPFPDSECYSTPITKMHTCDFMDSEDASRNNGDEHYLADWKQLRDSFLTEASGLYREAIQIANSARVVEGVIYNAVAQTVVKNVFDSTIKKFSKENPSRFSALTNVMEAPKPQKQKVKFEVPAHQGNTHCEYVAPRQCTPFRPAPVAPQRIDTSVPYPRMIIYDSSEEDLLASPEVGDLNKPRVSYPDAAAKNKLHETSATLPIHFQKIHQESPPVPFKLRTSNPVCNRLLRKMVEKHFSDESTAEEEEDIDESITATGDAKAETLLDEKTKEATKRYSSVTTQTAEKPERMGKTDALIQTRRQRTAEEETDATSVDREMQTPTQCAADSADVLQRRVEELLKPTTTIQRPISPLLRHAAEKPTESADLKNIIPESKDIVTGAGDFYRQQAETVVMRAIRRAVSVLLVEKVIGQTIGSVYDDPSSETFGAVFDRNTPNIPDSAKETLNIVTPTSSSDVLFRWSSSAFERAAASLAETTRQNTFKWTPYREEKMTGPSRVSGVGHHHVDSGRVATSSRDETTAARDEETYISADSSGSDDEFVDAQSQTSDEAQHLIEVDGELRPDKAMAHGLVDDFILEALALRLTKEVILYSINKIAKNEAEAAREQMSIKTEPEDREAEWSEIIVVSNKSSATDHDHTYVKADIGGTRDSATTIETVSDSQGESGFSDAQSSISDLFHTEEEDNKVIKEIVDGIMRRAVNVVIDGVADDWNECIEDAEKFSTPENLSESESGISAASSYHSVTSDVTDVTLLASEVDENAAATPTADKDTPQVYDDFSVQGTKSHQSDSMSTEDSMVTIAFLREQLSGVKALVEKFQQADDAEDNFAAELTSPTRQKPQDIAAKIEKPDMMEEQQPEIRNAQLAQTYTTERVTRPDPALEHIQRTDDVRSEEPIHDNQTRATANWEPTREQSLCVTRKLSTISDVTVRSRSLGSEGFDDSITVVERGIPISSSSSADSRGSGLSLKRESSTSIGGVRKRPRVKTHVFFWEKMGGNRKKVKKSRERPLKPVTPAKETIQKFEEIARETPSSSSFGSEQSVSSQVKKSGFRRRLSEKFRHGPMSKARKKRFWKNKAFFSALEENANKDNESRQSTSDDIKGDEEVVFGIAVVEQLNNDDAGVIRDSVDSARSSDVKSNKDEISYREEPVEVYELREAPDQRYYEVEMSSAQCESKEGDNKEQMSQQDIKDTDDDGTFEKSEGDKEPEDEILKDEHGDVADSSAIDALVKPSKSEEEIQAWMEKCKKIKERTAMLLNKCAEGEHLHIDDSTQTDDDGSDSGPSRVSSHDTGEGIFPFGVPTSGDQVEMFNPDQHIAALEEDSDWVASSSDDIPATQVEAVMKESSDTLKRIDEIQSEDVAENADKTENEAGDFTPEQKAVVVQNEKHEDAEGEDAQQAVSRELPSEQKPSGIGSSETSASYYDAEMLSQQTSELEPFHSTTDVLENNTNEQPLQSATIKKQKKKFKLFKLFKSKKSRKMADTRESSTLSTLSGASHVSEDTLRVYSPSELKMGSDSWSTNANSPSDQGAVGLDSWDTSGVTSLNSRAAITPTATPESSTTDASTLSSMTDSPSKDRAGKRSLRKRLFHFGGLKKSSKAKSSRHPSRNK